MKAVFYMTYSLPSSVASDGHSPRQHLDGTVFDLKCDAKFGVVAYVQLPPTKPSNVIEEVPQTTTSLALLATANVRNSLYFITI